MESKRIYVIVARNVDRPDGVKVCVTTAATATQGGHALLGMAEMYAGKGLRDCFLIYLSVASNKEFGSILEKLIANGIGYYSYYDSDASYNNELTAIATFPLDRGQAAVLKDLKPFKCKCNTVAA